MNHLQQPEADRVAPLETRSGLAAESGALRLVLGLLGLAVAAMLCVTTLWGSSVLTPRDVIGGGRYTARGIPLDGQVLLGMATTGDINSVEANLGATLGLHRTYYQANQVSAAVESARADLAAGRVPWLSFKPPASWSSMVSGGGDAWAKGLADRLATLPGPVWVAIHHEPEGEGAAAQWKAMQQRLSPIFRAKPNIAYSIILMGWHQLFSTSDTYSLDRYWPGQQYVDILGFDPYNWYDTTKEDTGAKNYEWTELRDYYARINDWLARTGNTGVRWAIAETGYTDSAAALPAGASAPSGERVSTAGAGADWLARAYDDMVAMGGIGLAYFDVAPGVNNEPADWTWPLNGAKSATFARLLTRSDRLTDPANPSPNPNAVAPLVTTPATRVGLKRNAAASKLKVNVGPNLPKGNWRFRVERLTKNGTWKPGKAYSTKGRKETRTINRKAGTYRVVVLPARGHTGSSSQAVKLRK